MLIKGYSPCALSIISLYMAESPEIFPIAQMDCSCTSGYCEERSFTNRVIPPLSTIDWVYIVVPEAMLVRAQAASNCL